MLLFIVFSVCLCTSGGLPCCLRCVRWPSFMLCCRCCVLHCVFVGSSPPSFGSLVASLLAFTYPLFGSSRLCFSGHLSLMVWIGFYTSQVTACRCHSYGKLRCNSRLCLRTYTLLLSALRFFSLVGVIILRAWRCFCLLCMFICVSCCVCAVLAFLGTGRGLAM